MRLAFDAEEIDFIGSEIGRDSYSAAPVVVTTRVRFFESPYASLERLWEENLTAWQERKKTERRHDFLEETAPFGLFRMK